MTLFQMTFNEHPFNSQSVSNAYRVSIHYKKWLTKWEQTCNLIKKFTILWQHHWDGTEILINEKLSLVERKLRILFATRNKCEVKIREEQPAD